MRRILLSLLAGLLIVSASSAPAHAMTCAQTIAAKFTKLTDTRTKLLQHCRDLVLSGRTSGPCPDFRTAAKLEKARAKFRKLVGESCGGADATCGAGGDDVSLDYVGWNIGQCPDLHGAGCTQTIGHCGDVAECLICVGESAVDASIALTYDSLTTNPPHVEINRCQATIGRSVARYFGAHGSALAVCEQRNLAGLLSGACPDPQKTAPRIARAEEKLVNRICSACGSSDDICGGDDIPPEWIGFPASCPAVTPPGGASCGKPIHQLTDIIDCVRCVTDYHVRCLDPLSVPTLKSYPGQCQ